MLGVCKAGEDHVLVDDRLGRSPSLISSAHSGTERRKHLHGYNGNGNRPNLSPSGAVGACSVSVLSDGLTADAPEAVSTGTPERAGAPADPSPKRAVDVGSVSVSLGWWGSEAVRGTGTDCKCLPSPESRARRGENGAI